MADQNILYDFNFELGDKIKIIDSEQNKKFTAEVVGVDSYNEVTDVPSSQDPTEGLRNKWVSYTLVSKDAPDSWGNRFWAVDSQKDAENGVPRLLNVERSFYVAAQSQVSPLGFEFEKAMSGRVQLNVAGDALHAKGAVAEGDLFTYREPETGKIWAEEVFVVDDGKLERMVFDAKFDVDFELIS